ncbi:MAG: ATP-binding protein [Sterolibacterium sp.]|nr:ATP-binding protein [Sterolibacterium sp.]
MELGDDGKADPDIPIHTGITDRTETEEELRSSLQLFRTIVETVSAGAALYVGSKLVYANQTFERLCGFTLEELNGMEAWEIVHPDMREQANARSIARLRGEKLSSNIVDYRMNTKSGAEVWVESHAPMIEYKGGAAVLCTFVDITERKRIEKELQNAHNDLEQQVRQRTAQLAQANLKLEEDVRRREQTETMLLRRNAELADLNDRLGATQVQLLQSEKLASIGQLAAGVAHEINNPIGYIHSNIGSLESYLDDLFRILDAYAGVEDALSTDTPAYAELRRLKAKFDLDFLREDIPKLMAESREGITRVRKIVQDLKDFSRVDSGQEWKWADLHRGLDSTLNVASNEIKYKAEVVKEYGDLPEVECLPSEINQVFLNLLVNAAHAIAEGQRGTITLRSGCDDRQVWIEVADTGSGIAPEILKRIFEPFFTTKPIGKGTGLGLSLSHGIVKKHGGRIEVNSEVGQGTTFRVILPINQTHEQVAQ